MFWNYTLGPSIELIITYLPLQILCKKEVWNNNFFNYIYINAFVISQSPMTFFPSINSLVLWRPSLSCLQRKRNLSIVSELGVVEEVVGPCCRSKKEDLGLQSFCVCLIHLDLQKVFLKNQTTKETNHNQKNQEEDFSLRLFFPSFW